MRRHLYFSRWVSMNNTHADYGPLGARWPPFKVQRASLFSPLEKVFSANFIARWIPDELLARTEFVLREEGNQSDLELSLPCNWKEVRASIFLFFKCLFNWLGNMMIRCVFIYSMELIQLNEPKPTLFPSNISKNTIKLIALSTPSYHPSPLDFRLEWTF